MAGACRHLAGSSGGCRAVAGSIKKNHTFLNRTRFHKFREKKRGIKTVTNCKTWRGKSGVKWQHHVLVLSLLPLKVVFCCLWWVAEGRGKPWDSSSAILGRRRKEIFTEGAKNRLFDAILGV